MLLWLAMRTGSALVNVIPLRVSYALARGGGFAAHWLWRGGRRRCIDNMRHVTDGDEHAAHRYARQSFGNYAVFLIDFLRSMRMTPEAARDRVTFEGWDELERLRSGNGIVFVTMHVGNWDLGAAALAGAGFPITVVADSFNNPRVDQFVRASREHLGMTVLPASRMGTGILKALRRNDAIAVLADVPAPAGGGIEVDFFGEPIRVHDGIARIALRTGASVVAATLPRDEPWSDRVKGWIEPISFEPTGDNDHDIQALTQAIFERLESLVRRRPEQWYIFRHLWTADAAGVTS
jgi:lauroyl/myristoyl acyltransferase